MPREHMDFIRGQFKTPFGPMDYTLTQANHVSISAGSSYDKSPHIIVNGILYHTWVHLFRMTDGSWSKRPDAYSEPGMTRVHTISVEASSAARKKAYEGIKKAWEAAVPDLMLELVQADLVHFNNEIMSADDKIQEIEMKLREAQARKAALVNSEIEAREAYGLYSKQGGVLGPREWSPQGRMPRES